MMIELVTSANIRQAAEVHAISWQDSHRAICSAEFIALHTTQRQMGYMQGLMDNGADIYLLSDSGKAVGIVSVQGNVIADLYVLPTEQGKGYGTTLLRFAMERCDSTPTLWVLSSNRRAMNLYERLGFHATGECHILSEALSEIEMVYSG